MITNYFRKKILISDIINVLKIDYGFNSYPNLSFKYLLEDNVLRLTLPSKEQYLLSRLCSETIITYNYTNSNVYISNDYLKISTNKKLLKHLRKCFIFLKERDKFNNHISEQREKMSKYIVENNKRNNKKDSIINNILYHFSLESGNDYTDCSSDHHDVNHNYEND